MKYTKICVSERTKQRLVEYSHIDEKWDDIITKMLDHLDTCDSFWCDFP